ncbi:hypothetical protein OIE66_10320 [Nonomuraea sp. NBC_01738]|uniref:hypothetical protein n=1 Tax=Nonomuraea sp. NBC_01738 TaxID=2976003 RepID=UPI002E0FF83B|nr:hypothetical protein OIE66_10320 [Nonomuraea sp. NBC_01738]
MRLARRVPGVRWVLADRRRVVAGVAAVVIGVGAAAAGMAGQSATRGGAWFAGSPGGGEGRPGVVPQAGGTGSAPGHGKADGAAATGATAGGSRLTGGTPTGAQKDGTPMAAEQPDDSKADGPSQHTDQQAAAYFRRTWSPDDKALKRIKDIRTVGGYLRIYTDMPESAGDSSQAITLCERGLDYLRDRGVQNPIVFVQAQYGENGNPVLANILGPGDRSCRVTHPDPG